MSIRLRLSDEENSLIKHYRTLPKQAESKNVLVIGDLHQPFTLDGYLDHCQSQYKLYNCNQVIFIGDIIDNHFSSYHETDADGMGGGDELSLSIHKLKDWYKAFPKAIVIIGNHDRLVSRKAQTGGIPNRWIKQYNEVLEVNNWQFTERYVIDNVQYIHGEGGTAASKCKSDMMPTVQGHLHSEAYVQWFVGQNFKIFGMQVGCGVNNKSYALAYAKAGKKPAIGCGVVLGGKIALNCMMEL